LRERRIKKNVSQNEMAKKANITQTFLSLIEHGKRIPSREVLQRIAKVLDENAFRLEKEAGNAELDSVMKIDSHLKRILGSGNKKTLRRIQEFFETLG